MKDQFKGTIEKINQIQSNNRKVSSNCIIEAFSESFIDNDGKRLQNIFPFSLDSDQIIKSYKWIIYYKMQVLLLKSYLI